MNAIRIREERLTKQLVEAVANNMFDAEYLHALVDVVYAELEAAWRRQVEGVSEEQIPQLLAQKGECQTKIDKLIDFVEKGGSAKLKVQLEPRYSELERIESRLKARGAFKLETTRDDVDALVYQSVENLVGVLKEDVALTARYFISTLRN